MRLRTPLRLVALPAVTVWFEKFYFHKVCSTLFFSLSSVAFCSFSVAFFSMASVYCIGRNGQMDGWEGHGTELKASTQHDRASMHAAWLYQNVSSHSIAPFRSFVDLPNRRRFLLGH